MGKGFNVPVPLPDDCLKTDEQTFPTSLINIPLWKTLLGLIIVSVRSDSHILDRGLHAGCILTLVPTSRAFNHLQPSNGRRVILWWYLESFFAPPRLLAPAHLPHAGTAPTCWYEEMLSAVCLHEIWILKDKKFIFWQQACSPMISCIYL